MSSNGYLAEPAHFVDHRTIDWARVKRTTYFVYQRFHYKYPGPVRHLHQNLVVVPADTYGDQSLCDYHLTVAPHPASHRHEIDRFGNRIFRLEVDWIAQNIAFEVQAIVERRAAARRQVCVSADEVRSFLDPTGLTEADAQITSVARDLAAGAPDQLSLAQRISDWVSEAMRYGSGKTGVATTAAQALKVGQGLCQDYAHIMLAICRVAGLPARYVSGHMLGEGGSHAWVEVFLPASGADSWCAVGFDPTNRRQPNLGYTTVAVGRDYKDVAPTSGSFSAPYGGRLSFTKRAGLTEVEFLDGKVVRSS